MIAAVGQWVMIFMVIAGLIGVCYVIARATGVNIPGWLTQILLICLAVFVGVLAVKFLIGIM